MKKFFKILGTGLLLFLGAVGVWVLMNFSHIRVFPSIISSLYAKEMCSCLFVVGRDEKFCHNYVRKYVAISDFKLDAAKRVVTVSGLGRTNSARFVSERYGCVLNAPLD